MSFLETSIRTKSFKPKLTESENFAEGLQLHHLR